MSHADVSCRPVVDRGSEAYQALRCMTQPPPADLTAVCSTRITP